MCFGVEVTNFNYQHESSITIGLFFNEFRFSKDAIETDLNKSKMDDLISLEKESDNYRTDKKLNHRTDLDEKSKHNLKNTINQLLNLERYLLPNKLSSLLSIYLIAIICLIIIILDLILVFNLDAILSGELRPIILLIIVSSILILLTISLSFQPRNGKSTSFQVPLMPYLPLFR